MMYLIKSTYLNDFFVYKFLGMTISIRRYIYTISALGKLLKVKDVLAPKKRYQLGEVLGWLFPKRLVFLFQPTKYIQKGDL